MKIVCVNKDECSYLTLFKEYKVYDEPYYEGDEWHRYDSVVVIKNDNDDLCEYEKERFIGIKEYRKQKLDKINRV